MNDLQIKEFELLCEFDRVCKKLDIEYYLVCGSALGAVKYNGFIPWDDDIDVALERADYEKLLTSASDLISEGYFLQTYRNEKYSPIVYAKLRNSNTTYIEKSAAKLRINHGVYIDVFPLDGYPVSKVSQLFFEFEKFICVRLIECSYCVDSLMKRVVSAPIKIVGRIIGFNRYGNLYNKLIKRHSIKESKYICNFGNSRLRVEYAAKDQYGNGTWAMFEELRVRIPEDYDAYLTQKYGDWRKELPIEEQVGHHYYTICDLDRPYTYYTNKDNNNTK